MWWNKTFLTPWRILSYYTTNNGIMELGDYADIFGTERHLYGEKKQLPLKWEIKLHRWKTV